MGTGGIATCENCGMEYSQDRMKEKVQEIKGTVRVDNTHMIQNYLSIAQNAYEASNQSEAELYCNKVIEIDPTNYQAWLLKGKTAGWQSTLQNPRFSESVLAFSKAIENAPEEEKNTIIEESKNEIKSLGTALISLRTDRFVQWPDEDETQGFLKDITTIMHTLIQFISQVGESIPVNEMMGPIATQINQAVVQAWSKKILPDYQGNEGRPNEYEWRDFLKRIDFCIELVTNAINLSDEDDEEDIQRYENLIFLQEQAIKSCSWDYNIGDYGGKYWYKDWSLTDSAKAARRDIIAEYQRKMNAIKSVKEEKEANERAEKERIEKEKADKRFKEYWEEHVKEKENLEKERNSIEEQIKGLKEEMKKIPGNTEISNIEERINKLCEEKDALGMLKIKEKKAIQEKIDLEKVNINIIKERMNADKATVQAKIKQLQSRVDEINFELAKAR